MPPSVEICYLLLLPFQSPLPSGVPKPAPVQKDIPYFFDLDIEFLAVGDRQLTVANTEIQVYMQVLDEQVWLAECRYQLAEALSADVFRHKQTLHNFLRQQLQREAGYTGAFIEEYTVVLLRQIESSPDEFIESHAPILARLLRTQDKPLTDLDIAEILRSRVRYSRHDLTLVDWEGAVVIAEKGDFQSDIELLKIGNYQLLRYRLLDRTIELNLQKLREHISGTPFARLPSRSKMVQAIIEQRLSLLLDFEKIDQSLLLIGDWYSAQVYQMIVDQFYLDEWKAAVSAKLDSLNAIDEIVRQNLAFSWNRLLDLVQIVGWLLLLIGYFVLFFMDLGWFS